MSRYDFEQNPLERLLNLVFGLLYIVVYLPIKGIVWLSARLVVDVAKNIYGRAVIVLGSIGFALIAAYFAGIWK